MQELFSFSDKIICPADFGQGLFGFKGPWIGPKPALPIIDGQWWAFGAVIPPRYPPTLSKATLTPPDATSPSSPWPRAVGPS